MFSEMEYPHWMMVAGACLVVAGFIGLGISWYMNGAPAEDNPRLDGYSIAVLRPSERAPRFSE